MASVREEEPPLTHAENEEFLRMLRKAGRRMGREDPQKVEIVFEDVSVEAELPAGERLPPTLPNAMVNGVKIAASTRSPSGRCRDASASERDDSVLSGRLQPQLRTCKHGRRGDEGKGPAKIGGEKTDTVNAVFTIGSASRWLKKDTAHICAPRKKVFKILDGVSGTIRSSRMTLVLGAPGSGKTTFLKTLAGKLDSSLKFNGTVLYNGETCSSIPHFFCAYVGQHDLHHAEMTVRETINFASNLLGASNEFEVLGDELQKDIYDSNEGCKELFAKATKLGQGNNLKVNYILKILGLSDCADTIVGDELRRGISGGQKKRTTIDDIKHDRRVFQAADPQIIFRWAIFKACFLREVLLARRNSPIHIFKAVQITFLAFVLGTLFFRTEMDHNTVIDGNKYMGALFMSISVVNFNGMTELTMTVKRLPVFYKQRELLGLPGWAILCSIFLINIPMSLMETGLWTCSTYYTIGYAPSPVRFFQQLLVFFAMHQISMSLYRFLASLGRTQVMANLLGTEALIAIIILGGFIVSQDDLQPWLQWGSWVSPFTYSLNAVALNEFLDKRWSTVFHYENVHTIGEAILKVRGLINEWHWYWVCVGVLFGFSVVFNILSIFALELLLMKRGGQLIYSGTLGPMSSNLIKYFEAIPGVPCIKDGQNPAAWVLDISSHAMEYVTGADYSEIYRNSSLHKENMDLVGELSKPRENQNDLHFPPNYWQNFKSQCMACVWKQNCSFWKNPELNVARFMYTFGVSITFGVVFWQIGSTIKEEQDVLNILGIAFTSALFLGFVNCCTLQPIVVMERVVFYRERSSGMYSSMAYVIAQIAAEIPYMLVQVFIFSAVVYPMVGFQQDITKFFWFVLYVTLSFMDFTLYGVMVVSLTPNQEIAAALSFFIFVIWNIFSGFIIPRKMIPAWWRWMYWADPAAWTVYGLMLSQLGDRMELIQVPGQPDQPVSEFLREYLGLQDKYFALVTALHIGLITVFGVVFCISIKYVKFHRR
ncbi:hypothetical protein EJB05_44721 [Eragrostis curvula]|uniref:ABC transporter domain-containing protein n=1 Tax=Eragrostis curvula TaxID=38414 RepID=A0A5J9TIM6_9POAL|nr:hypothetical protein EJB05_44721 [Eragrostis curvula]